MDKLKMHTPNKANENFEKLAQMFPNAVTETKDENGEVVRAIDKDVLMQEINCKVVEGREERYQFTWPDKKQAILNANAPINKTLRPCREESVDFDNTENLYIEGDNLEVLKLLQETYLGKIKMIYIDPPYNTGNDFVYNDKFSVESEVWRVESGEYDENGNKLTHGQFEYVRDEDDNKKLVLNSNSNGRFHTDWLNMIYPRLKLAKDLLADDGVIFISIDDNEVENLKKCCDEIFGNINFYGIVTWSKKRKGSFLSKGVISLTEYVLVYTKNISICKGLFGGKADSNESQPIIKRANKKSVLSIPANTIETKLPNGCYKIGQYGDNVNPIKLLNDVIVADGRIVNDFSMEAPFVWSQRMFDDQLSKGAKFVINTNNFQIRVYKIYDNDSFKGFPSYINGIEIKGTNEDAYEELCDIFQSKKFFDYSKPKNYIKSFVEAVTHFDKQSIVLDFFSGSATTAHAVMQLNAEDGGKRKFIMVQLPELTDEKSEAYKAGYKNICEIGKERIRRAGNKILNDATQETVELAEYGESYEVGQSMHKYNQLDVGFRVLKLDSSNMKDVYYNPDELDIGWLTSLADNIKEDRTSEDLLFQVMLDLGILLSSKIQCEVLRVESGVEYKYFNVADGFLIACFGKDITDEVVTAIAKQKPYYFVMRDSSMASDSVATNFEQIFATYSPDTVRKVL